MADKLVELRIREEEAAREWQWLQDTLHRDASCRLAYVQRQTKHLTCRRTATAG